MRREILTRWQNECLVTVVAGEIASIRRAEVRKTGLRLLDQGRMAVAGALGEPDLEALEAEARRGLAAGVAYPDPESERESATTSVSRVRELRVGADLEDHGELLGEVEAVLEVLRTDFPELLFSHQVGVTHRQVRLEDDQGTRLEFEGRDLGWGLLFKRRGSSNIIDGMIGSQGRRYRREDFLSYAREVCQAFLNPVPLPRAGRQPVIFLGGDGLSMPLSFFERSLDGRIFGSGASPLSELLGEQVYAPDFTLEATRHPDDVSGAFFDDEGWFHESLRVPLVEAGVLRAPFTDRRTAKLHDLPRTGAAGASYDGVPTLSCPHLRVRPGDKTLAECLGGEPGVLVSLASGGEFTPDGAYASPVQLAFLHDGTRLLGRLPELEVRGSDRNMFGAGFRGAVAETWPKLSGLSPLVLEMEVTDL